MAKKRKSKTRKPENHLNDANDVNSNSNSDNNTNNFPIVGIGASAGGLEAFSQLLEAIPVNTGMAFIFVQHLAPTHESLAPEILSHSTGLKVLEVRDGMSVSPDHVYLIPPNTKMTISNGVLNLLPRTKNHGQALVIDTFFQSLALDQKEKAIGIILSGTATDGTLGLKSIKAEGGLTMAQDPDSAKFDGMPKNAIATHIIDFISTPKIIAKELARISKHPYIKGYKRTISQAPLAQKSDIEVAQESEKALGKIFTLLKMNTQVDFSHYKQTTVNRRVHRRMVVLKFKRIDTYAKYLKNNPSEVNTLFNDILINVTAFFRDPDSYVELRKQIFPKLIKNRDQKTPLRLWVVGCSTGEEVYSLAIVLFECIKEARIDIPFQIFATDISETAIQKARCGLYSNEIEQVISKERLNLFFEKVSDGYKITKEIRDQCLFSRHDIASDPPFSKLDFISCRNVLIYFTTALQKNIIDVFHYALNPGGFLWLGSSESPGQSNSFKPVDKLHKLYSKANILAPKTVHFTRNPYSAKITNQRKSSPQIFKSEYDFQQDTDKIILSKYAPPSVVVNTTMEILQFRGRTSPFLEPAPGPPSNNLIKMVRPELLHILTKSIQLAAKQGTSVRQENLTFESNGKHIHVNIEVLPLNPLAPLEQRRFVIFFEEALSTTPTSKKKSSHKKEANKNVQNNHDQRVIQLEQELLLVTENQHSIIEEFDTVKEELTSAIEELQSANEELQSANEELETAKEELQSTNEELNTVNEELQNRNNELAVLSSDLNNLLVSTEIPILIVGADLRIRRFTPKAEKAFNLIPSDIGRPIANLMPNFNLDLDNLVTEVIDSLATQEKEVQDRQGYWWRIQIRPYKTIDNRIDGAVVSVTDIDLLKQQVKTAVKIQNYLTSVADTVRLPLVILDEQLQLISANPIFWKTFNLSPKSVGSNFFSIFALCGDDSQKITEQIQRTLAETFSDNKEVKNLEVNCEFTNIGKRDLILSANQIEWIEDVIQQPNKPKEPKAILLGIEDITERRRIKEELAELLVKERHAREEADNANQTKDLFLGTLSHELRTPLSSILTWAQLIHRGTIDFEKAKQGALVIERSAITQSQIIDDLLDISRIASGKIALEITEVNIRDAVRIAIESIRPIADKKSIQIESEFCDDPIMIHADTTRFQQIIWNLLTNSIKFSPENSTIYIKTKLVDKRNKHFVQVIISDRGEGIPAEFLPQIFNRFSQADSRSNRVHGGLGLGLSIVHSLVELINGTIKAENASDGKGASFTITFPLISQHLSKDLQAKNGNREDLLLTNDGESKKPPNLDGLRILYVEDNDSTREAINIYLKSLGADVTSVDSAKCALDVFPKLKPDILVSDIAMPGEDGYSLIKKIRKLSNEHGGGNVPALALTAYATVEDANRALTAGFQAHLKKPVDAYELGRAILKVIKQKSN